MKNPQSGFTLAELLVSIAIFSMITVMAVFGQSKFNGTVLLTNLAYEIALSVRQAQFYGITVKQSTAGAFDSGYGVRFDTTTPTSYDLFQNNAADPNRTYNLIDTLETFNLQKGNKIGKLCVDNVCTANYIEVSFVRPNPDAYIKSSLSSGRGGTAEICVVSPQGDKRKVVVESTGQISVQTDSSGHCN